MKMSCKLNQLTPTIESKVFIDRPESRFALGVVATNNDIVKGYENEFYGAAQLRANTYLDSGYISSDDLDDNGTELDQNDYSRSVHFIMLERTAIDSMARVVGNMRLIIKSQENTSPLPLENYYPDVFAENPITIGGVEVSRLISRHEDSHIQNSIKWPLFVAGQKYIDYNQLGSVYGLLSPALTRLLRSQRIPVSAIASERFIKEINATKQPVAINMSVLKRLVDIVGDHGIDIANGGFSYLNIPDTAEKKAL
ncbi:hypothetical protein [Acetobacterium malicum]|uniref:hypothetical protein n=1 Tax=Acetobacterium malicum TaxID=52692 RepID=UPI0003F53F87|nr:hypothetical protein [Acetobacterium dehalogenans]